MADTEEQESELDGETSNGVGERERSGTRYPFYDLEEAEKFVKSVQECGGNEVLEDDLLKHLNLSRTTKSWVYKLSTAREFGLIEKKGQKSEARITITDRGKRLMLPGDDNELAATRAATFLAPSLYQKLFERYKGAPLPQPKFLANTLVRDHKIVDSVSESAAVAFISSAKHAGMVNAANVLGDPRKTDATVVQEQKEKLAESPKGGQTINVPADYIVYKCKISGGRVLEVPLPRDFTKRDVDRLTAFLQTQVDEEEVQA
jgi:hypothetical protein